ncbi:MAG: hypothetical protein HYW63_01995 [Candidatus Levybacteria bacterium]|nr:hypothetical protein [Candidatus Levybacteria bacterium]
MRKILLALISFFILLASFAYLNPKTALGAAGDKCENFCPLKSGYKTPQIFDGIAAQCGKAYDCDPDQIGIGNPPPPYCLYESTDHEARMDLLIPVVNEEVCTDSEPVCRQIGGCSPSDLPDPGQCENVRNNCTSNAQCREGDEADCSTRYCLDRDGHLFNRDKDPYLDINGKCETKETPPTARPGSVTEPNQPLSKPCSDANSSFERGCVRIKTAFGWVGTSANNFTRWVLGFVLSISGAIVILIIIISGYRLMTSAGDPEKIKNARDQLTAAIVGLLFIIFSLVILELITRDILGLPGFGG